MLLAAKEFIYGFLGLDNRSSEIQENIYEILKEINLETEREEENLPRKVSLDDKKAGQSLPHEYSVEIIECVYKTGKVTYVDDEFGTIDNTFYFNVSQISTSLRLNVGDEIAYTTYKVKGREMEKVDKILALKSDSWESENLGTERDKNSEPDTRELSAMSRLLNGMVTKRKRRKFFIEPQKIWCDLDQIEAKFVPMEGDWICIDALVSIDENAVDLSGNVISVNSISPTLTKNGNGRITYWDNAKNNGAIENKIFFCQSFCPIECTLNLGDEVTYLAMESNQGKYKWRALQLTPKRVKWNCPNSELGIMTLKTDKNGISIKPLSLKVTVELNEKKNVTFEVTNIDDKIHVLSRINVECNQGSSQIRVMESSEDLTLYPQDTIKIHFEIKGRYLGESEDICKFEFDGFTINKLIVIEVGGNETMNNILNCNKGDSCPPPPQRYFRDNFMGTILYGPKPWRSPKFIVGEKNSFHRVPEELLNILLNNSGFEKKRGKAAYALENYWPHLKEELKDSNYVKRFQALLFLEEIELKKNFAKLDQRGVILHRKGEYLAIEIHGLQERSPSPIIGDKVILTQPWYELKNIRHKGYIYEILENEVLVKFHESFQQNYDNSECDINFEPSLGNLQKAHNAVIRAVKKLGPKWLFPAKVEEKPPQIKFQLEEEDSEENFSKNIEGTNCQINKNASLVPEKKILRWFNKKLNEIQKAAVINALKSSGRPLPYIIFGPPGTGKTVTLVELIMQIYHLIPHSRILVATPSNSACDLLCERLIDAGQFKPGELVRLIAHQRARNQSLPLKLVPYSSLINIEDDSHRPNFNIPKVNNIKVLSRSQLIGRQRIILGTCTCLGTLHFLGFSSEHFTHILIDEAAQASEPDILIPATLQNNSNSKVVLVGDPKQLGPVCFSRFAIQYGINNGLMQRFLNLFPYQRDLKSFPDKCGYDPRFVTKLQINYRSVPEILSLPSKMFYNSELISTVSSEEGPESNIIQKFHFMGHGRSKPASIIFHNVIGKNLQERDSPSWYNPHEVWEVVTHLKTLYNIGLTCDDVGVIAPYTKQRQKLKYVLNALKMATPKIGTVEDFQGQERSVIIVTTVRSNTSNNTSERNPFSEMGFLLCPRRLNVMLTRARALLIILGNAIILSKDSYWKTVVDYCKENKSLVGAKSLSF